MLKQIEDAKKAQKAKADKKRKERKMIRRRKKHINMMRMFYSIPLY